MESTTLYDALGGKEAVGQVVENFYQRVLADDVVNGFFAHTDMEKQKVHQTHFISFALGGPNQYTGKSMAKAHEGLNLQPVHFDAIAKHLHDALADFNVDAKDIQTVLESVSALKDDVLYK